VTGSGPLFDPERHEALTPRRWDEAAVREAIRRIVEETDRAYHPEHAWPAHLLDTEGCGDERYFGLYFGAAGVSWALDHLEASGAVERQSRADHDVERFLAPNRQFLKDEQQRTGSLLMGDTGVLLVAWRRTREPRLLDLLEASIRGNVDHPSNEMLFGTPGTLLAATWLHEATGEDRWAQLAVMTADRLLAGLVPAPGFEARMWQQHLYGLSMWLLGIGHGFAGNAFALLRTGELLGDADTRRRLHEEIARTALATATRHGGAVSWADRIGPVTGKDYPNPPRFLMHVCHGAPGFVLMLAAVPPRALPEIDALIAAAAETVWAAGPLSKGPGLCHGTAGNGYAFLKLWKRTGDPKWLERARAFAMHALDQMDASAERTGRRYSLWTGDLGVACFLWDCVREAADFPTLDVFF
jgi:lantibiotic modifying enzyme